MKIDILSLFPDYFEGPFSVSMLKRAKEAGLIDFRLIDIRDFAEGKHRKVDDRPYGGGPGMVLCPEPVVKAIRSVRTKESHVVYLSPQGSLLNARKCESLSQKEHLILLCGHYEGIDARIESEIDEEISIGDYVLTSGCAAAVVLVDAVSRFIPGVIGHPDAVKEDSFENGLFDGPKFTGPLEFEGRPVPPILREGNHAKIRQWNLAQAYEKTCRVRPDLVSDYKNLCDLGSVKASELADLESARIKSIRADSRSANSESFHASPNRKDFCSQTLVTSYRNQGESK